MSGIDIIIPWVDGNDPEWRKEFLEARSEAGGKIIVDGEAAGGKGIAAGTGGVVATGGTENASEIRYRDWGTLPYLFRGLEKFAPWVRRIHFVTQGHLPPWLDTSHPKLNVVRHDEFIPAQYLPTFASRPIELNVHRIEGLAERFVLFNDDMFLLRPVPENRFFSMKRGKSGHAGTSDDGKSGALPCDMARLSLIASSSISHTVLNMTEILNRRHDRRSVMRRHPFKWYSPKYGLGNLLKTADLALWQGFAGLADTHMPQPYLRSTFEKMWKEEGRILDATCRQKFRSPLGVNHWLMRYEQLATGRFVPVSFGDARLDALNESRIDDIEDYIRRRKYAMICLNDSPLLGDFKTISARLIAALDSILPEKSDFELSIENAVSSTVAGKSAAGRRRKSEGR